MENSLETVCLVSFGVRGSVEIEEGKAVGEKKSHGTSLSSGKSCSVTRTEQKLTNCLWS